ncbi:FimB/Mfa2 family fimbrial subunit [Parabacteroides faecis]|uniref:FimB/Mfa2 family fimbrial subunit n=1 Tax=Parabacteroides faecis TaxID=1217282 RepID=A0ABR6KHZ2_9BACT|nr:FimB/Mfa2 family fimbrial subunit [Parabacteroides faecis]MBB4620517.1 hypothetical protein [Parabacteroides faecis]GGK05427.1 hypothetical protein GCM10007084_30870 [Parabacteroides faecis]
MKRIIYFSIMLWVVLMTGCIKEDLASCDTNLVFKYFGDGTKDIFPEKIEKVDLYVYGENGALVQTIGLDQGDLRRVQGTPLNLPAGKYRIICWGNSRNDTRIDQASTLNTALVAAPHYFTKELITTNDSLYIGSRDIEIFQDNSSEDTVYFSSSHIKMYIELVGLEEAALADATSPIDIEIGNLSPTVDFTKTFSSENVSYRPVARKEENSPAFDTKFNVLRFNDDNGIYINLIRKETNKTIYTLKLKDFMQDNRITVNGINEVTVGIRFRFNGTSVTVKPWDEEVIIPGLG